MLAQGAVIVLSVLFALAVDRIANRVDEAALERTYLEGLRDDLQGAQLVAAMAMSQAAARDTQSAVVLATLRGRPTDSSGMELARSLELAGWVVDAPFPRDTWDDMVSTGHLGIIGNGQLRASIANFYRQLDQQRLYYRDWVQMVSGYSDIVRTILDPELRMAIGSEFIYKDSIPAALEPNGAELARRIAARADLVAEMGDVLLINKTSARLYEGLGKQASQIQALIDEELGKH